MFRSLPHRDIAIVLKRQVTNNRTELSEYLLNSIELTLNSTGEEKTPY